jgi:hypothetical protein
MIAGVGHQQSFGGWSSSLISKIWRTVMNSGHWLVKFKVCIITTAWRQRNSKHLAFLNLMIGEWWFLANIFHFCKILWISKLFKKIKAKELLKEGSKLRHRLNNLFYYIKKESKVVWMREFEIILFQTQNFSIKPSKAV